MTLYTVGHSNTPVELLLEALLGAGIEMVVDVRRFPASRRNPQFNREAIAATLARHAIEYRHVPELGGRRPPLPDSPNAGLRDPGFRGFADYMATPEFDDALTALLLVARTKLVAIMCAESVPWRCHRSLIADAVLARGESVRHLIGDKQREHTLSATARVNGDAISYPALL